MTFLLSKDRFTVTRHPRLVFSVLISLGILVAFVTCYSWISLSCPVGSAGSSYFCVNYGARDSLASVTGGHVGKPDLGEKLEFVDDKEQEVVVYRDTTGPVVAESQIPDFWVHSSGLTPREQVNDSSKLSQDGVGETSLAADFQNAEDSAGSVSREHSNESDCDLLRGQWYFDPAEPLYRHSSCPVLSQSQDCQGNGRPDKEYENWRWKPSHCELPRFNASKFMELMSGKTLTFVGDSVARNQMESLMCLLWQVEVPKSRGNRRMQRWYFRSKSVTIVRIWSSWLVHHTSEPFKYVPEGVGKIHLDVPDEKFMEYVPRSDVVVFNNGHWFTKRSVYLVGDEIVGSQLWTSPEHQSINVSNMEAYRITTETALTALATHQNYSGLTIVMSYSPDHYKNEAWNTGGSCTGRERPLEPGQLVENSYTNTMHEKQLTGFNEAVKKRTNQSKLKLIDITEAFGYRHDGHPGPYRSTDPNKITQRGPNGRPPPQDCLHWCMPGPIDTWNELLLETIRREFAGDTTL